MANVTTMSKGQVKSLLIIATIFIALGIAVLIYIAGQMSVTGKVVSDSEDFNSEDLIVKSCVDVEVPHQIQQTYMDKVPYTDKDCEHRRYDAKAGYISEDGSWKGEWTILYGLFNTGDEPVTEERLKYYIINYEERLGDFIIRVNYYDSKGNFIESYNYIIKKVGPKETEYDYIYYELLWKHKPENAESFNVALVSPDLETCQSITKYRKITKTRTVIVYTTEQRCD